MIRRQVLNAAVGAVLASAIGGCDKKRSSSASTDVRRVVSLAPSITETLFAIGAGEQVVAVSDYCDYPEEARTRPRLGTGLTPHYERIARLDPTLIVTEANASARRRELEAIAPTRLLPWLSLDEIADSVRELGVLTGRRKEADGLSQRLRERLDVPEPPAGPRVLLVLGGSSTASETLWFVRRNSLHGAALHAAGARNAVPDVVNGPPELPHERLLSLDPDAILILTRPRPGAPASDGALRSISRFTTLRAVREKKIEVLEGPEAFANGPRILGLVDKIRASLVRLGELS